MVNGEVSPILPGFPQRFVYFVWMSMNSRYREKAYESNRWGLINQKNTHSDETSEWVYDWKECNWVV